MSQTRDNHYVPQWYQRQFFEPGRKTLAYLDLQPEQRVLGDGRVITPRAFHDAPTKRCFFRTDLYSTFFGTAVNDEIERRLFGAIDDRGSKAVRAYQGTDQGAWHEHFQNLFEYLDIQKIRTPKGLEWLRAQYPALSQNELMMEMQGIRFLHCTIWTEGVREIVSAEDSDVKFIVSDHPVTVYNYAVSSDAVLNAYPRDPGIALKASQTIFPLGSDFCLILTNLEYAQDPACAPLDKRTFARNFRSSMVNTINYIRTRRLSGVEVAKMNHILKTRARRYIAAGRETWLYPEEVVSEPWHELRTVLLPPANELWHFGGELFAGFDDGRVHYQDAFGRTEKERDFLIKPARNADPKPGDACSCGSALAYKDCCKHRPAVLRPSWEEMSIRERNLALHRGIVNILGLDKTQDWAAVRRALTDEQISRVYLVFEAMWPRETDLLKLLPKPDGRPRAVYTGSIHPETFTEFAAGAALYFGELIVEHPFLHNGAVNKEFSPVDHPRQYHLEFLKSVAFFHNIMPLIDLGLVNLVPDLCSFDIHLRDQMMHMAKERSVGLALDRRDESRLERLVKQDMKRTLLMRPRDGLEAMIRGDFPDLDDAGVADMLTDIERLKEADPLVALVDDIFDGGEDGGQLQMMKMAPNFEMAMYLAQATGASIITDSPFRWKELQRALRPRLSPTVANLRKLADAIQSEPFLFPWEAIEIVKLALGGTLSACAAIMRDAFQYLSEFDERSRKPNWEAHIAVRFAREHSAAQTELRKRGVEGTAGRISCAFPAGGIQDNTVNRLLLMSSSEYHLPSVPMAFLIEPVAALVDKDHSIFADAMRPSRDF